MYRAPAEASPLVVVTCANRVVAHDRHTGHAVWELVLHENAVHNGCVRCVVEGERVVVTSTGPHKSTFNTEAEAVVTCVDYRTGRLLWEQRIHTGLTSVLVVPSLLVDGGQVLVTTGNKLCAMSLEDGTPHWSQPLRATIATSTTCGLAVPGHATQSDRS